MNELIVNRTPDIIALEINSIKDQTRKLVLFNSIEIGRRLTEAKEIVNHGEWGEWLENSVAYSKSTANNLMRIFEEYSSEQITLLGDNAKSQALGNLSYTQALLLLGIPSDQREDFIKENDIDKISSRELQNIIKEKQELEKKLKETEEKAAEEHNAFQTISSSYNKLEKTNQKQHEKAESLRKELEKIESKNQEALTNKEVEIENLKIHIEAIKKQQSEAKGSGNNEEAEKLQEVINNKESELIESNRKIEELERLLNEKPIEIVAKPEVIEKIPEEVEKELQELREKVKHDSSNNKAAAKFSVYFDSLVKAFQELLGTISEIEDEELKANYKKAITGLIGKMGERL